MDSDLTQLERIKNLGPESAKMLADVGIRTLEDIREFGSVNTYTLLKERGYHISLVMVYALEGAIRDVHWNALPDQVKEGLKRDIALSK